MIVGLLIKSMILELTVLDIHGYQTIHRAFCKYCVFFPQKVIRGAQWAVVIKPCTDYKDFNEYARRHLQSTWHKGSHEDASNFVALLEA